MYQISCDTFHNKLVITLHKSMNAEDFDEVERDLRVIVPSLSPNFTIINDISRYVGLDTFPVKTFRKIALYLKEQKVGKIIRVVGNSKEGLLLFASNSKGIENYDVVHVPRLADAVKVVPHLSF